MKNENEKVSRKQLHKTGRTFVWHFVFYAKLLNYVHYNSTFIVIIYWNNSVRNNSDSVVEFHRNAIIIMRAI